MKLRNFFVKLESYGLRIYLRRKIIYHLGVKKNQRIGLRHSFCKLVIKARNFRSGGFFNVFNKGAAKCFIRIHPF